MRSVGDMVLRQLIREILEVPKFRTVGDVISAFSSVAAGGSSAGYTSNRSSPRTMDMGDDKLGGIKVTKGALSALLIGDSQLGAELGREFSRRLQGLGYKVTMTAPINGGRPGDIASKLTSAISGQQLVVAFAGGNDSSPGEAVSAIEQMRDLTEDEGAHLIVIGPPAATKATDPLILQRNFNVTNLDYQLTRDNGRFASNRVEASNAIDEMRDPGLLTFGIASHFSTDGTAGHVYPDQPDGLHCNVGADEVVDVIFDDLDIDNLTDDIKAQLDSNEDMTIAEFDYDRWKEEIAQIESRGNYQIQNSLSNALGKYQFVPSIWWDDITEYASSRGKTLNDWQDFLNDPQLQEDFMLYYTKRDVIPAVEQLRRELPNETSPLSTGKIAALIHFQGPAGASKWLRMGVMTGAESNAIDPDQYTSRIT